LVVAFVVIEEETLRRKRVNDSAEKMRLELQRAGFNLLGSTTQIVPVCFCSSLNAAKAAAALMKKGIYAPAYRPPAVPEVDCNIRVNVTADHTNAQLEQVTECLIEVGKKLSVID
ncbi:MAG: aminotransferase class I/II-fold pyridoxal phosphate-dependent enzyme, partial [Candidatus Omnitrophota bacterium]